MMEFDNFHLNAEYGFTQEGNEEPTARTSNNKINSNNNFMRPKSSSLFKQEDIIIDSEEEEEVKTDRRDATGPAGSSLSNYDLIKHRL